MKMKKFYLTALLTILFAATSAAQARPSKVPATPHPIEVEQPNGDKLTIRLYGDERKHYNTTIDGFVIVQNEKGYYCYAKLDKKGNYAPTKTVANNEENRKKSELKFLKKQIKKDKLFYKPKNIVQ